MYPQSRVPVTLVILTMNLPQKLRCSHHPESPGIWPRMSRTCLKTLTILQTGVSHVLTSLPLHTHTDTENVNQIICKYPFFVISVILRLPQPLFRFNMIKKLLYSFGWSKWSMFRFGIIIPFHQDVSTDHEKHKLRSSFQLFWQLTTAHDMCTMWSGASLTPPSVEEVRRPHPHSACPQNFFSHTEYDEPWSVGLFLKHLKCDWFKKMCQL